MSEQALRFDTLNLTVRVLIQESGDWQQAHILDFDVVGQARTKRDALYEAFRILACEMAAHARLGRHPLEGFGVAPDSAWRIFEQATPALELVAPRLTSAGIPVGLLQSDVRAAA